MKTYSSRSHKKDSSSFLSNPCTAAHSARPLCAERLQ